MAVTADDHKLCVRSFLFSQPDQVQPVISRHPDICDHDIRVKFFYFFQRLDPVLGNCDNLHSKHVPVHKLLDQLAHLALVVGDQYSQHPQFPPVSPESNIISLYSAWDISVNQYELLPFAFLVQPFIST